MSRKGWCRQGSQLPYLCKILALHSSEFPCVHPNCWFVIEVGQNSLILTSIILAAKHEKKIGNSQDYFLLTSKGFCLLQLGNQWKKSCLCPTIFFWGASKMVDVRHLAKIKIKTSKNIWPHGFWYPINSLYLMQNWNMDRYTGWHNMYLVSIVYKTLGL